MTKIKLLLLGALLVPALVLFFAPVSHSASGNYIDCIHGCPDLIDCTSCCNQVFSSILATCDARWNHCEALCPPGNMDCLDKCVMDRNNCLTIDVRHFDCPHWKAGGPQPGLTKEGTGFFSRGLTTEVFPSNNSCSWPCH